MSQILWLSDTYLPYFATVDMQQKQLWFGATKLGVSDRYKPFLFAQAKLQISLHQWTNERYCQWFQNLSEAYTFIV